MLVPDSQLIYKVQVQQDEDNEYWEEVLILLEDLP